MHAKIRTHQAWPFPEPAEEAEPTAEPALLGAVESRAVGNAVRTKRMMKVTFRLFTKRRP